jgi:hypothetical protein
MWFRDLIERDHSVDLGVNNRLILKLILKSRKWEGVDGLFVCYA